MNTIKKLSEMLDEEIEGAEEYIKCALKHKEEHPEMAKMFYDMSFDEAHHATMLHDMIGKIVINYHREHGEAHPGMSAVHDFLHERYISKMHDIKMWQDEYKDMRT